MASEFLKWKNSVPSINSCVLLNCQISTKFSSDWKVIIFAKTSVTYVFLCAIILSMGSRMYPYKIMDFSWYFPQSVPYKSKYINILNNIMYLKITLKNMQTASHARYSGSEGNEV